MARLRKAAPGSRALTAEAVTLLGLSRGLVLSVPFRWLARNLGEQRGGVSGDPQGTLPADQTRTAETVGAAIEWASRHTPWRSNCLAKALAGRAMLARRGVPAALVLGVKRSGERLEAHAWLYAGERIVTGGAERPDFTAVVEFGGDAPVRT